MSITHQLRDFLTPSTEQQPDADGPSTRDAVRLYRCSACETTYVSTDMEACSTCGTAVESVPTARDLGML
jgi:DNA-directed RNA polymerase subunit RPC12/RpoP